MWIYAVLSLGTLGTLGCDLTPCERQLAGEDRVRLSSAGVPGARVCHAPPSWAVWALWALWGAVCHTCGRNANPVFTG